MQQVVHKESNETVQTIPVEEKTNPIYDLLHI